MTWLQRYRIRRYAVDSLWVFPVLSVVAAIAVARLLNLIEVAAGWASPFDPDTARAVLGTMASAMFTFVVFVSSALLVAVQLASATLSPRIIAVVFKDPVSRFALTLFVFTFTFTLAVLVRITSSVPSLSAIVAAYSSLASLGVFLYLLDHVGKVLRPSGALQLVASIGREVIAKVYPEPLGDAQNAALSPPPTALSQPALIVSSDNDGVVLAFDLRGIVAMAERSHCIVEMVPQVGDFVATGDPLFRIHEATATISSDALRQSVAVGQERTLEQDPMFSFRIVVDVASKGLSPAINDPTTAVLAIDQLHHLLRSVGCRELSDGYARDSAGRVRLIYRTPEWEDFVYLAVTEIRQFGGTSIQVARRLRAMLENLVQTLPTVRQPHLRKELELLRRSIERYFPEQEDRALAGVSDAQGVGGKPDRQASPTSKS